MKGCRDNKTIHSFLCVALSLLWGMALSAHSYAATAKMKWVQDSWVPLLVAATDKAAVLRHLVTNQELSLVNQQSVWCEIEVANPVAHGFVKCASLGAQLTLSKLGSERLPSGESNPDYPYTKAFWIEPSLPRLLAAGQYFWVTKLTATEKSSEFPNMYDESAPKFDWDHRSKPKRFAIPEFDAMKAVLTGGVIATRNEKPAMARWKDSDALFYDSEVLEQWKRIKPLPAKPSLFKSASEIAPGFSSVQNLSAQFDIKYQMRVLGGADWIWLRNEEPTVAGSWDIGSYELYLSKPVIEQVIGRHGLMAAKLWKPVEEHDIEAESGCDVSLESVGHAVEVVSGYPHVKDPLLAFYVPAALPYKKVSTKTYAERLPIAAGRSDPAGYVLVVSYVYDLDGDTVGDLAAMEFSNGGEQGDSVGTRVNLANIAGEWYVLTVETYSECT